MAADETTRPENLDAAVARLEQRLEKQLKKAVFSNRLVLVLGIVLAIVIVGYLGFAVGKVQSFVDEPATMAQFVLGPVKAQVREKLEMLRTTTPAEAPKYVAQARESLMEQVPKWRQQYGRQLVDYVVKEVSVSLKAQFTDVVGNVIKDQKVVLEDLINQAASKEGAKDLHERFNKEFAVELQKWTKAELAKVHKQLRGYRDYMRRLRTAQDLTAMEVTEKEWIVASLTVLAEAMSEAAADPFGAKEKPETTPKAEPADK